MAVFLESNSKINPKDWLAFFALLLCAVVVRQIFFIGPSGSDDGVYLVSAFKIANGDWDVVSRYNGELRFGFHIPMAMMVSLFGASANAVNAFSLLCSLFEILFVFLLAFHAFGRKVALLAAALLAFTPLHMMVSTAVHADPVAAFGITASVLAFYFAEQSHRRALSFVAGLATGYVFWVKELIIFYGLIFPIYMLVARRWDFKWLYMVGGGLFMLAAHLIYMAVNAGDAFYLFKVMKAQIANDFVGEGKKETNPAFYFKYLFFWVYWTLLLGWLSFGAIGLYAYRRLKGASPAPIGFVIWWCLSLLALFTLLPISLSPFQFVTKQSNYINLFLAPMSILSAWLIAQLHRYLTVSVMAGTIVAGTMLLALHQAIIRVHVSGSEQVHLFAMKNPHIDIYAANNTLSLSLYRRHARLPNLIDIRNLPYGPLKQGRRSFVAVDPMTIMDVPSHFDIKIRPSCWRQVKQLFPVRSGLGIKIFHALLLYVPSQFKRPFESRLQVMTVTLYEVDPLLPWCTQ